MVLMVAGMGDDWIAAAIYMDGMRGGPWGRLGSLWLPGGVQDAGT